MKLLPVVEGYGDVQAVPHLLRRMLLARGVYDVEIERPFRHGEYWRIKRGFSELVRQLAKEDGCILVLVDCEDGCAAEWAAELIRNLPQDLDVQVEIAFMVREFETLFLADPETTRQVLGIQPNVVFPEAPEAVRDAKGWLTRHMQSGERYRVTIDQERLAAQVNLDTLRNRSPSFRHLERSIDRLVGRRST